MKPEKYTKNVWDGHCRQGQSMNLRMEISFIIPRRQLPMFAGAKWRDDEWSSPSAAMLLVRYGKDKSGYWRANEGPPSSATENKSGAVSVRTNRPDSKAVYGKARRRRGRISWCNLKTDRRGNVELETTSKWSGKNPSLTYGPMDARHPLSSTMMGLLCWLLLRWM